MQMIIGIDCLRIECLWVIILLLMVLGSLLFIVIWIGIKTSFDALGIVFLLLFRKVWIRIGLIILMVGMMLD